MESFSRRSLERNSSNRPIWKPALPDVAPFFRVPKRKCDRVKEVSISHFFQTTMADTHLGSGVRAWSDLDFLRAFENLSFPPDQFRHREHLRDRKSTRLNSSHVAISYAVFCLKKKT